ncbi:ParB/RepB/Spo0J family partition protein [Donghicola tyrosinivorans]|jgi:ParB family chromosome partitioning protein|uniref:ParB family chromosome partitioning protein n=1 Tax=Donghicola tyrosinivorans TaxID=1652492 RepID=A0A2T0WY57_9RHOB|nr:ParB/RepB/Spo0J family partition protein [Donghicola tyrosinivorans]PRY91611.1 ParB family chromosome partitioning protein [Donghicola tyrosinivorans]
MNNDKKLKRGLGRGLSALMADVQPEQTPAGTAAPRRPDMLVPIERIEPNPEQPRRVFAPEALQDLANSIREKGVIQPLIVRVSPRDSNKYEIVAGERRWRASQMAQLHQLPILVRDFDDTEVLEVAIIENIQRADLNPVEEAAGYKQLMEKFGHTQERLAEALGKSRSYIANSMRLLQLPEDVIDHLQEGRLSTGHARALITSDHASELAKQIVVRGLSVRDTERLVKKAAQGETAPKPRQEKMVKAKGEKDADTIALEGDLSAALGMRVSVDHKEGTEEGTITVKYASLDQLDEICRRLSAVE